MWLDERARELLEAAREVLEDAEMPSHASVVRLSKAVLSYDRQEQEEEELDKLPAPALATVLPDTVYAAHLWMKTDGGLYAVHDHKKKDKKLCGPDELHVIEKDKGCQMCMSCASEIGNLALRRKMASHDDFRRMQSDSLTDDGGQDG